jgi:LPXTG-site transpeptidase (sortase) family protein
MHRTIRHAPQKRKHVKRLIKHRSDLNGLIKGILKPLSDQFNHVYKIVNKKYKPSQIDIGLLLLLTGLLLILIPRLILLSDSIFKAKGNGDNYQKLQMNTSLKTLDSKIQIDSRLLQYSPNYQPPLRIVIPKYSLDLPIVEANVINGVWETSETSASHGVGSANPGENGNIVIFAHAREGLFLPLRNINKDTLVYILTKDRWYRYRISDVNLVSPENVSTISASDHEILTLFTCSGFLDSKRAIVKAIPYQP